MPMTSSEPRAEMLRQLVVDATRAAKDVDAAQAVLDAVKERFVTYAVTDPDHGMWPR